MRRATADRIVHVVQHEQVLVGARLAERIEAGQAQLGARLPPAVRAANHPGLNSVADLRLGANATARRLHGDPLAAADPVLRGQWIAVETPSGRVRAQAQISDAIQPGVVCCSHGWWEACAELGLPGFDPFSEAGANQNLLVLNDVHDPVSGGTPHRSTLCRVSV